MAEDEASQKAKNDLGAQESTTLLEQSRERGDGNACSHTDIEDSQDRKCTVVKGIRERTKERSGVRSKGP